MQYSLKSLKENPLKKANCLSKLVYGWVYRVFIKRTKRELDVQDLYQPLKSQESAILGNRLENLWQNELERAERKKVKPNLFLPLAKMFWFSFFVSGFPMFVYSIISVVQPVFLSELLKILAKSKTDADAEKRKYIYGGIIIIMTLVRVFFFNHYLGKSFVLGMRMRIACCSLLYRKMLRLSHSAMGKITAGHLVNLISNDVNRFDIGILHLHYFWIMPIQVIVGIYIIWYQVGLSSLTGIGTMALITIPIQGFLGKLSSKYRLKVANRTDTRVKHMSEIISGIQVIKMYAWEKPFEKLIDLKRKHEISGVKKSAILKAVYLGFIVFTDRVALFATIICYTYIGYTVSSDKVFSLAQFFNVMQLGMAVGFPLAVNMGAEILVAVRRMRDYLILEENPANKPQSKDSIRDSAVILKNINATWDSNSDWRLRNISINVHPGALCTVIGSVGSGKSSILHLIIKELIPSSGTIRIGGEVSYASQEPWLFVGSVRDNVLFGNPYEKDKYREVVRVCALEKDYKQFPYGDKTIVGERGVSLSGGQRARINLARAVYKQSDIYILDDPLSAVDAHVSRHLFDECISGYLKNKTRILVTHQLQFLKKADLIVVVKEGQIVAQGTFNELVDSNLDIKEFLHVEKDQNDETTKKTEETYRRMSVISNTSELPETNDKIEMAEEEKGTSKPLYWPYFRAGRNYCLLFFVVVLFILAQAALNCSDLWLTYWIDQQKTPEPSATPAPSPDHDEFIVIHTNDTVLSSDNLNSSIYNYYTLPSNHTETTSTEKFLKEYAVYIYTGLMVLTVTLTFARSILFIVACMMSSINLHNTMFHFLLQSYMRFFDTNPSGRILNRFSKDMGVMDEVIPKSMLEATQVMLVMIGILIVIMITNVFMAVALIILGFVAYKVAILYTNAARDIKRIEGITRSPVFSHVKTSYDGLATIRSSFAQSSYKNEFDMLQDLHTSAWYLTIATRTAFGICLDLCTVVFIIAVVFSFIYLNEVQNDIFTDSKAGLAISQSMILTGMVQMGSQQVTEVINQMTSVERILQYTKLDKETSLNVVQNITKGSWPTQGRIEFKKLYLSYAPNEPPVLKNLNFLITPGQKVGVVGRTGAGKSSIISALFRLSPIEGSIFIDMVDTKNTELSVLRSKISIIPQKPVLFSASVRYNLDPFDEYEDDAIWNSLEEVELKESIPNLDYIVHEGGVNFSVGQRQLLCLARAILRNNKILILDEATANVDQQTDALIQSTIRRKFEKCTVLTIAHRLNTIMDSDVILVMHAGELVEMGHPFILLQNTDGYFSKLVADNEESVARKLHRMASETYLDTVTEEEHTVL